MVRAIGALLFLLTVAASASATEPLAALDACLARLDSGLDIGYARIQARCPELTPALEMSRAAAWLPDEWKRADNRLDAAALRQLRDALAREAGAAPGTRVLHPERMPQVLKQVVAAADAQRGWWARFKRWLRELLAPPPHQDSSWWRRLLGEMSVDRAALRLLVWLSIALLVVLAAAVLVNELRVAGLLRRRARSGGARLPPEARARAGADLENASLYAQPALLLELVVARLAAQDRLPPPRALTVNELTRRVRLGEERARLQLATLTAVSEQIRYGEAALAAPTVAAALQGGRELLAALDAVPLAAT